MTWPIRFDVMQHAQLQLEYQATYTLARDLNLFDSIAFHESPFQIHYSETLREDESTELVILFPRCNWI